MSKFKTLILALATTFIFILPGCNSTNIKPIQNGNRIGVVLMHGKGGDTNWVDPLSSDLKSAGIQVMTPNMPWHRARIFDKTFDDSMLEIQENINKLKSKGARTIYIAGHSLGAVAASGYAARHEGINGIILLAPGHFTDSSGFHYRFGGDLTKANDMISSGTGDEVSSFGDINMGKRFTRSVTAKIYSSWYSPDGPAEFVTNMRNVKGGIPILYVAGAKDKIPNTKDRDYAFDHAPTNNKSKFTIIDSTHLNVPKDSSEVVIEWIRNN